MRIEMDVRLDPTLGCGQAHRWFKDGGTWHGVLGSNPVALTQTDDGFDCSGNIGRFEIEDYFRPEDDLCEIMSHISECDPHVARLSAACPGLRILRQEKWECLATYLLATNANVKRIGQMVESVCETFGDDLGGRCAFPSPSQILDRRDLIRACKLGFREGRFLKLAERVENNEIDLDSISGMEYEKCAATLMEIDGVGPKVADCVSLFAFGHLVAFPVDARISKCMEELYGVTGSYRAVSGYGMARFGKYAGYAQELLYHRDHVKV
ncbi:MAG: hypothetical protein KA502_01575 [Candidatus Methanomethylophilaceae archaeon]|nr:hypothetical protein [Candidatus Methanomethylophilaceae archaeon]